jgi:hypothetical protein
VEEVGGNGRLGRTEMGAAGWDVEDQRVGGVDEGGGVVDAVVG